MNNVLSYWDAFLTTVIRLPAFVNQLIKSRLTYLHAPSVVEQSLLLKRLAMMLQSGLPIATSLRLLSDDAPPGLRQSRLQAVVTLVEGGMSLQHAMERGAYHLTTFAQNLIRIGERLGTLPENLEYIAIELKAKHQLQKQIIQALIYPAIIILATVAISVFLVVVIFPKIIPIFQSLHSTLPWSTRALLVISSVFSHYGLYMIIAIPVLIIAVVGLRRFALVHLFISRVVIRLPIVGRLIRFYTIATSCRTLSILLASNVPITEALSIVNESTAHVLYKKAWQRITAEVETGQRLARGLERYPALFPSVVMQLVQVGETTGNLSSTLRFVAEMYEEEVRDITKNLTTLLEPILMLFMGLIVGFIAVAIITPIYGITQHLHG